MTRTGKPVGRQCLDPPASVFRIKVLRARVLTEQSDLPSPSFFPYFDLLGQPSSAVKRCFPFSLSSSTSQRAPYPSLLRSLTSFPLLPKFASNDIPHLSIAEDPPGSACDSVPSPPAAPPASSVEKKSLGPGESRTTKDGSKSVAGRVADKVGSRGTPGSHGQGAEADASRLHTAEERVPAVREAEAALMEAAAKLAEVRAGSSTGLATTPKRQRLVLSVKEGVPVQSPPISPGESGGQSGASDSATVPPGDRSTDRDAIP